MKVLILCADGPHNQYLILNVCKKYENVKIFIESGHAQLNWKLKQKKYKQYYQLKYQMIRRKIFGSDRYRRLYFAPYLHSFCFSNYNISFVNNINEEYVVNNIKEYKPDIGVVMGTSILHEEVLNAMDNKDLINIHGGYLPYYKGNHCIFFAYYNKEYDKIGSTIHFINSGVDSGDIIERITPKIETTDTPESLYCKAEKEAVDRLMFWLEEYRKGTKLPRRRQESVGRIYYTRDRKLRYDLKLFLRQFRDRQL